MGKKKKKVAKVWCYYCEREFEDEKILVQHQKAKHFKCHVCHKKLSTAGGMAIHVLQVHKETITKVPNAKPDRESTEIDIFGMQGIPPEILAAHDGDQDEELPAKLAKVEVPSSGFLGGMVMGSTALGMPPQPIYSARQPTYAPPSVPVRPPVWPAQPNSTQPWLSVAPVIPGQPPSMPMRPPQPPQRPPQPLFPIQNAGGPPSISAAPSFQPLFPIRPPTVPPSTPPVLPPQPLFPINGTSLTLSASVPSSFSVLPPVLPPSSLPPRSPNELGNASQTSSLIGSSIQSNSTGKLLNVPPLQGAPPSPLTTTHMYASGPNTGGPSIGPPPVISNKAPVAQSVANEVYLVWDDEAMSMEERRLSLRQYQVHDETLQMNSVDAAIDRRISESRLAGRIGFGI